MRLDHLLSRVKGEKNGKKAKQKAEQKTDFLKKRLGLPWKIANFKKNAKILELRDFKSPETFTLIGY